MAIQSAIIRMLTRMAASAIKNPKTRDLGKKLTKELTGPLRNRGKAIKTASEITKKDPKIRIFQQKLPSNAMESEKDLFWDMVTKKEYEQLKKPTKNITLRKGIFYNKKKDIAGPSYFTGMRKTLRRKHQKDGQEYRSGTMKKKSCC